MLFTPGVGKHTSIAQRASAGRSSSKVASLLCLTSLSFDRPGDGRFFVSYSGISTVGRHILRLLNDVVIRKTVSNNLNSTVSVSGDFAYLKQSI